MSGAYIVRGDARRLPLKDKSVQCVVTSPPYFGLRSYGGQVSVWGGEQECEHEWIAVRGAPIITGGMTPKQASNPGSFTQPRPAAWSPRQWTETLSTAVKGHQPGATCTLCGAWAGELGSEPTPALFVAHLVEVFREVKRVLRDDGVCFLNIGDSYSGSGKGPGNQVNGKETQSVRQGFVGSNDGSKPIGNTPPKSLLLVPERLAIALSDDGWIIRSRIAWCKAAPMPESVRDRPTSAWEHIWCITKQGRYYWDQEAVRETASVNTLAAHAPRVTTSYAPNKPIGTIPPGHATERNPEHHNAGLTINGYRPGMESRNLWNYWVLPPDPYPGSHFATFPRAIPERCIKAASREGDVVLDPFSGSATTAYVAASLGRVGVGVELSAEYCEQARYGRLAQDFLPLGGTA